MAEINDVTCGMTRDERCAADVAYMASMGSFGEDFLMYGCAYLEHGKVTYRISPEASQLYLFQEKCAHQQLYPTTVTSFIHHTAVPGGMREQVAHQTKLLLAQQLREQYPHCFFEWLEPFTQTKANNSSFDLLADMAYAIDGYFDEGQLQLMEGTMELAYGAKVLNDSGYAELLQWLEKTRRQMEADSVIQDVCSRTLYGFCYQDNAGNIKSSMNAQLEKAYEKHTSLELSGKLVGPVMQRTYWMKSFNDMNMVREAFKGWLEGLQNENYFALLTKLKALPTVINQDAFAQALQQIEECGQAQAIADFKLYGRRWNAIV